MEEKDELIRKQVTAAECLLILRDKKWQEKTIDLLFRDGPPKHPIKIGKAGGSGGVLLEIIS